MADQTALSQWTAIVGAHLSRLSTRRVRVLAWWRLGMVLSRSCALPAVSLFWATALGQEADAVRQRLREWCDAAADKAGAQTCYGRSRGNPRAGGTTPPLECGAPSLAVKARSLRS